MKVRVQLEREYELNYELDELGIDEITDIEDLWKIEDKSYSITTWLVEDSVIIKNDEEDEEVNPHD
ncbi:hypothetical protein ACFQ3W_24860 [Paenibacillus puldeungensis]|uniref:Uncharacterized protein n=1 Tax=Paenibacillus puldeungensis TaxID=696536 RepID=A0ABW3S553_9BACL